MRRPTPPALLPALVLSLALLTTSCSLVSDDGSTTSRSADGEPGAGAGGAPPATPSRADAAYDRMTPQQRVGQLFMFGMTTTGPSQEMYAAMAEHAGGNVFLRGQSDDGADAVRAVTDEIAATTTFAGVRPFISADQEGGNAQGLEGDGFSEMPTGVTQGTLERADLKSAARGWAKELLAAGVNVDLAPVADVVPADVGADNAPIGFFRRQYGDAPETVKPAVSAFVSGMQKEQVATAVKHFPGLGRATGNTDSDASATDPTVRDDDFLAPFQRGVKAGSAFVMVSSARYPAIDPDDRACFSTVVMQDMLRGDLGFEGVIISDSFGSASVAGMPPGERALTFFTAGGTMLLDTNYLDLEPMSTAVLAAIDADPAFAETIEADVRLVLETKDRFGLLD